MDWRQLAKRLIPRRRPLVVPDYDLAALRLHMHHVGGRDGYFPFVLPQMFHPEVESYIYDADPDCLEYMKTPGTSMVRNILIETIGARDGAAVFHLNYDPYTSSLRPAGPDDWYYQFDRGDYTMSDVLQPLQRRAVQAKSLATVRRERGHLIDYLSLDVQGAEGELLDGLDDAGWRDVLIVNTEVSTRQLYAGQALFHEICAKLYARGFVLAAIPKGLEFSEYRTGLGWRGTGFPAHGDALFFRDCKHLVSNATWPILSLYKLAFFVLCTGNVAYALKCAAEARRMGEVSNPPEYIKLVQRISELHASEDEIMPPGFAHIWTAERSLARFGPDRATEPPAVEIRKRYFSDVDEDLYMRAMSRLLDPAPTAFETLLQGHGLGEVAQDVRRRRLEGARITAKVLGTHLDKQA
jgi:FkbM family methyltransferase